MWFHEKMNKMKKKIIFLSKLLKSLLYVSVVVWLSWGKKNNYKIIIRFNFLYMKESLNQMGFFIDNLQGMWHGFMKTIISLPFASLVGNKLKLIIYLR